MNHEALNLSIRRFLKSVGVNSQREIEQAVSAALADGRLGGDRPLEIRMVLELPALGLSVPFEGRITLE